MKKLIISTLTLATILCTSSCRRNIVAPGCSNNTEFQNAYSTLLGINNVTLDANIHAYSFEVTAAKTVCKIGYRNQTPTAGLNYTIEIFDATANTTLLSQSFAFSAAATDYLTPTSAVNLVPGHTYWLKRIQASTDFANQVGRLSEANATFAFPITNGVLKITGAKFYPLSTTLVSATSNFDMIPFIDIQFQ